MMAVEVFPVFLLCSLLALVPVATVTSSTPESADTQRTANENVENHQSNQIEDSNQPEEKDAVSLFFQVIKMYKKSPLPWTTSAMNELKKNRIRSGHPSKKLIIADENGNSSAHTLPDVSDFAGQEMINATKQSIPEASALVGSVPAFKIQDKKQFLVGGSVAEPSVKCSKFCAVGHHTIGLCVSPVECYKRRGSSYSPCCGSFVCCKVTVQCGETSQEELLHFQSPNYPIPQRGSVACDFELVIQPNVCAVRIDFADVRLHSKFGGVCDVDQFLILNSVDGPISAQCGDLSGYTTTVAVHPGHPTPLKLVVIVQGESSFLWDVRLRQIACSDLLHLRRPAVCGAKTAVDSSVSFYQLLDLWRNAAWHAMGQHSQPVWWRQPQPSFNKFYFASSRKALTSGGMREQVAEDRIIHGMDADLHEFPWQVAVVSKRVFFCGGVLINDEYVLSAAHCFLTQDTPMADLVVYLGDHDLTSSNETISEIRGVRELHYHAHFHALLLSNDIAMLRLDRPVTFSLRIRPVCLPQHDLAVEGETGVVAGWGITSYPDGKPNAVLQRLQVQVMSNEFCEKALDETLGPGHLCAVPVVHGGTCFGDSGGPLTVMWDNRDTLIGIVSFGITGCALAPGMPDLYTRVSAYLKWIDVSAIKYID